MRRTTKKLRLKSETVAALTGKQLEAVNGAWISGDDDCGGSGGGSQGYTQCGPCDTAGNQTCYIEGCGQSWYATCSGQICPGSGWNCGPG